METIKKLIEASKKQQKKDHDVIWCITGREGSGKSHLMLNCLDVINPDATIEDVGFNVNGFISALKKAKRGGNPVFDEAGDGLYSRESMTKLNRILAKVYMAIRGYNLFTILIIPDWFDLDGYFRKHRVKGLFVVSKRGSCGFYNKRQIDIINSKCEGARKIWGVRPSIRDHFPIYKGHLAKDYNKFKQKKIKESLKALDDTDESDASSKTDLMKQLLKLKVPPMDISRQLKITNSYVYRTKKEMNL